MTSAPRRWEARSAAVGATAWIAFLLVVRPRPFETAWIHALLLLAPLVLVPLALGLSRGGQDGGPGARIPLGGDAVRLAQPPAALLLAVSYLLSQGPLAAALSAPWLAVVGLVALEAIRRLRRRGPGTQGEWVADAGAVLLVIGATWAAADRLGYRPLGFAAADRPRPLGSLRRVTPRRDGPRGPLRRAVPPPRGPARRRLDAGHARRGERLRLRPSGCARLAGGLAADPLDAGADRLPPADRPVAVEDLLVDLRVGHEPLATEVPTLATWGLLALGLLLAGAALLTLRPAPSDGKAARPSAPTGSDPAWSYLATRHLECVDSCCSCYMTRRKGRLRKSYGRSSASG